MTPFSQMRKLKKKLNDLHKVIQLVDVTAKVLTRNSCSCFSFLTYHVTLSPSNHGGALEKKMGFWEIG